MSRHSGAVLVQLGRVFGRGTVSGLSEESLLDRFVRGKDEAAFAALVARHGPMVLGICRRVLRNEHEVEDAFQATFLVFVRRAGAIRDGGLLGHWLYGVAHRVAVRARANAAKKRLREPNVNDADHFDVAAVTKDDSADLRKVIDEELARLPDSVRAPIVLCYLEGLTHEEAASRLGWPLGTVRSRMARGRDTLRQRLSRRGVTASDASLATVLARPSSLSIPASLFDATVKASLSFQTIGATSAVLASTSAASLAQGVLHAMTLTKLSAFGAVALSGLMVLGGWQTYGRSGQDPNPPKDAGNAGTAFRVTNLENKLELMAADLKALRDENRRLQDQLRESKNRALPPAAGSGMAPAGEVVTGMPGASVQSGGVATGGAVSAAKSGMAGMMPGGLEAGMMGGASGMMEGMGSGGMPGMMGARGMGGMPGMAMGSGGGMAAADPNQPVSQRIGDLIFVTSPGGNKVSILDTTTGKAKALTLSSSKDHKPWFVGLSMIGGGFGALQIQGAGVSRIAAYSNRLWYPIDLVEPTDSAVPIIGNRLAAYTIGRRVYAFSAASGRWDFIEVPKGMAPQVTLKDGSVEFTHDGHLYTFSLLSPKWVDTNLDPKLILDAPEDKPGKPADERVITPPSSPFR